MADIADIWIYTHRHTGEHQNRCGEKRKVYIIIRTQPRGTHGERRAGDRRDKTEGVENMQVTDVRVRRVEKEGKMKAIVSITLDNEFVIHDIKVIEGEKGLVIAMPSRKAADGEYRDIAHPINSNTRDMIQTIILNKYETTLLENEAAEDGMA